MKALVKACENLGIEVSKVDEIGNLLQIKINDQMYYFSIARVPINDESVSFICSFKSYTYRLLKDELPMPKTRSYNDPNSEEEHTRINAQFKSQKAIVEDIVKNFDFPVMVKMSAGLQGKNVFKCDSKRKVAKAVKVIFNQKKRNYDSTVLAQKFIDIKNEYRVILLDGEIILLYEKVSEIKNINLSPLHNDDGKAVIILDEVIKKDIADIVDKSPILKSFPWIGLDIARDADGGWVVLELNVRPGFSYFIRDNGDEKVVEVYEKLLNRIKNGKK